MSSLKPAEVEESRFLPEAAASIPMEQEIVAAVPDLQTLRYVLGEAEEPGKIKYSGQNGLKTVSPEGKDEIPVKIENMIETVYGRLERTEAAIHARILEADYFHRHDPGPDVTGTHVTSTWEDQHGNIMAWDAEEGKPFKLSSSSNDVPEELLELGSDSSETYIVDHGDGIDYVKKGSLVEVAGTQYMRDRLDGAVDELSPGKEDLKSAHKYLQGYGDSATHQVDSRSVMGHIENMLED